MLLVTFQLNKLKKKRERDEVTLFINQTRQLHDF